MPSANTIDLATLDYRPQAPKSYSPNIGVVGCGGISKYHLMAYRNAGFQVTRLCDLSIKAAETRRDEFFPTALVTKDFQEILDDSTIEVVDITTHPAERVALIEAALQARKHVLSQKPFVLDLDVGERLVELARSQGVYLAVNQNGRWAPHFSYARAVQQSGVLGSIFGAHLSCHWDHTWVQGTEFENIRHLILYDYAIHWFDILRCFLGRDTQRVFASTARAPGQSLRPDLLGQAAIEFESAQATLAFDAAVPFGSHEKTFLSGTQGVLHSRGTGNQDQSVFVTTELGTYSPRLEGKWFPDGLQGTMSELLCSIEEDRPCSIDAADNLKSLELCFAALHSADTGEAVQVGTVRKLSP
jgi:predicted dehydrogenase